MANKYIYLHVLQADYGCGYEDLAESESRSQVRADLRDHQANEGGDYRIIQRRELNLCPACDEPGYRADMKWCSRCEREAKERAA